jgi:predicted Zn-dependent protease with MMP-like domain
MNKDRFEELVAAAVEALPEEFQARLENIDVVVEALPSKRQLGRLGRGMTLLGLYEGVPLTERYSSYGMVVPDKITIFQQTIESQCRGDDTEIKEEIGRVVRHEIAHHFGIGDARLDQIEKER